MISPGVECSSKSIAVMIFVVLAGNIGEFAFRPHKTFPEASSTMIALGASTTGPEMACPMINAVKIEAIAKLTALPRPSVPAKPATPR